MSKEKAVENIKEALKYTAKTSLIGTSPAEVASAVSLAEVLLLRALKSWRTNVTWQKRISQMNII